MEEFKIDSCRICLINEAPDNFGSCSSKSTDILHLLNYLVPEIDWTINDNFPSNVCQKCYEGTKMATELKLKCVQNNLLRTKYISQLKIITQDGNLDLGKEEITIIINSNDDSNEKNEESNKIHCFECDKTFQEVKHFRMHFTKIHEKESKSHQKQKQQNTKEISDKRRSEERKTYLCQICGKSFYFSTNLSHHLRIHQSNVYKCEFCERKYSSLNTLKKHKNTHHFKKKKPYLCQICGYRCHSLGSLHIHLQRHEHIYKFGCSICGKKFVTKTEIKTHMAKHSNLQNYVCKICQKSYKYKQNLNSHLKKEHVGWNNSEARYTLKSEEDGNENNWQCKICNKKFLSNTVLKVHLKSLHGMTDENNGYFIKEIS